MLPTLLSGRSEPRPSLAERFEHFLALYEPDNGWYDYDTARRAFDELERNEPNWINEP